MCSQNPEILLIEIVAGIFFIFFRVLPRHSYASDEGMGLAGRTSQENKVVIFLKSFSDAIPNGSGVVHAKLRTQSGIYHLKCLFGMCVKKTISQLWLRFICSAKMFVVLFWGSPQLKLPEEGAKRQHLMGVPVFPDRQSDFEGLLAIRCLKYRKTFAKSTEAREQIDYWYSPADCFLHPLFHSSGVKKI